MILIYCRWSESKSKKNPKSERREWKIKKKHQNIEQEKTRQKFMWREEKGKEIAFKCTNNEEKSKSKHNDKTPKHRRNVRNVRKSSKKKKKKKNIWELEQTKEFFTCARSLVSFSALILFCVLCMYVCVCDCCGARLNVVSFCIIFILNSYHAFRACTKYIYVEPNEVVPTESSRLRRRQHRFRAFQK